jgi:hypothetical protein
MIAAQQLQQQKLAFIKIKNLVIILGWFYLTIMLHLSLETLMAVYLSYPKNEKRISACLSFCASIFTLRRKKPFRRDKSPTRLILADQATNSTNNNCRANAVPRKMVSNEPVAPLVVRPGNACMIINVIFTIAVTLAAFVGGMVKGNDQVHSSK